MRLSASSVIGFLGAALAAAAAAAVTPAQARLERVSAHDCQVYNWTTGVSRLYDGTVYGRGVRVSCPVPSSDTAPHTAVKDVRVLGYDGNGNGGVTVSTCIKYRAAIGGWCSSSRSSFVDPVTYAGGATTGNFEVRFKDWDTLSAWSVADGFPYVSISMWNADRPTDDQLFGIEVRDFLPIYLPPL
jgi:hypothetical protein